MLAVYFTSSDASTTFAARHLNFVRPGICQWLNRRLHLSNYCDPMANEASLLSTTADHLYDILKYLWMIMNLNCIGAQ
jgi:hypothetical protein